MKSQEFKLRVYPTNGGVLNYLEMRDIFMNKHNTLKEERDRLALLVTKRTQSLECLKDYESTFIIIKDMSCYRPYYYVRFVKNCPKSVRIQGNVWDYANPNLDMLQLQGVESPHTTLIKKDDILKVIDPKDIPQDQIIDDKVSIEFLDTM